MNQTPEEMAMSSNGPEKTEWLLEPSRKPRDILRFMRASPKDGHSAYVAESALEVRLAEIIEAYTRWLICLTIALAILTVGLLAVAAHDVCFPKNAPLKEERTQTTNDHHVATPPLTN